MPNLLLIIAAIVVFISGYWLHFLGLPYGALLLAVHKLVALAAIVTIGVSVYQYYGKTSISAVEISVFIISGLVVLATVVSGGLVSALEGKYPALLWLHRILPYITSAFVIWSLYLSSQVNSTSA